MASLGAHTEHVQNCCGAAPTRCRNCGNWQPLELPAEIQSRVQCVAEDAALPEYRVGQILLFEQPLYHQSSTEIRAQLSAGTLDQNQVPQPVLNYIQTHQLYI